MQLYIQSRYDSEHIPAIQFTGDPAIDPRIYHSDDPHPHFRFRAYVGQPSSYLETGAWIVGEGRQAYVISPERFAQFWQVVGAECSKVGDFQNNVATWLNTVFDDDVVKSPTERAMRVLEEALEVVQASGVPIEQVHQAADYVYSKKVGTVREEVGDLMVSLAALASIHGIHLYQQAEQTIKSCWNNLEKIAQRNLAKPNFMKGKI